MATKEQPKQGIKIEIPAGEDVDSARVAVSQAEETDEVSGQHYYCDWTCDPWCGYVGWTCGLHTNFYVTVRCGNCGNHYLA